MSTKKTLEKTDGRDAMAGKYIIDRYGLLESADYDFNEDGSVNWRSMIPQEHLYANKDYFSRYGNPVPKDIEGLPDSALVIKLTGIKELAKLRRFRSVHYDILHSCESRVVAVCKIVWAGNYETDYEDVSFESVANATTNNTNGFGAKFLESIAENRAFVRAVRNFLNIHVVGADEIDSSSPESAATSTPTGSSSEPGRFMSASPQDILRKVADSNLGCNNFPDFKKNLRGWWKNNNFEEVGLDPNTIKEWDEYKDISSKDARKLLAYIKSFQATDKK
jgi:hypothetical protein